MLREWLGVLRRCLEVFREVSNVLQEMLAKETASGAPAKRGGTLGAQGKARGREFPCLLHVDIF